MGRTEEKNLLKTEIEKDGLYRDANTQQTLVDGKKYIDLLIIKAFYLLKLTEAFYLIPFFCSAIVWIILSIRWRGFRSSNTEEKFTKKKNAEKSQQNKRNR